ncbi:hypothetical protein J6TS2_51030 [Heyndrickxia sporothermodurans]|nr:hypothetical protein J6TS2_51030 [Heyndrickxia sporothermodurans]
MVINVFGKPSEMYDELLVNSEKLIDNINVIVSDNFEDIFDNQWDNLLYNRFIKYGVLDALIDKSRKENSKYPTSGIHVFDDFDLTKLKSIKNDPLKKAKGNTKLLAFDTKWLRDNRKVEKEAVPQRVYTDGQIKMKYGFVDNKAKKLIVVFQSNWANENKIHDNEHLVTHELLNDTFRYKKYQFFKYAGQNKEFDFIFLEDEFNYIYGWYMTNYGKIIFPNIQNFMKELSKLYDEIHFVGASKGGYGAYHIGKDLEFVKTIALIAPILEVKDYVEQVNNPFMLNEISDGSEELLNKIVEREKVGLVNPDRIYVSSGKSDYQYKNIKRLMEENNGIHYLKADDTYTHDDVIKYTYKELISMSLGLE